MNNIYDNIVGLIKRNLWIVVFMFSLAIIFGPAFGMFSEFNYNTPDIHDYIKLSNFDFNQSPIRRYRVIIPMIASGVNYVFGPVFNFLKPYQFPIPDFSVCMSFFVINSLMMSIYGMVVYKLNREYGASVIGSVIGLLSILTSRWTAYIAGLPVVDSLYLLIIAISFLGIKTKNTKLIVLSILLGPWAKESFIFIAPLIFFFSHVNKRKQIGLFVLSGVIVFSFRYYLDLINGIETFSSFESNVNHFNFILISLKRLFSFHGLYEVFSIIGVWSFLFAVLLRKKIREVFLKKMPSYTSYYIIIVLIHVLLSTDLARMFYLLTPLLAIGVAILFDEIMIAFNIDVERFSGNNP